MLQDMIHDFFAERINWYLTFFNWMGFTLQLDKNTFTHPFSQSASVLYLFRMCELWTMYFSNGLERTRNIWEILKQI